MKNDSPKKHWLAVARSLRRSGQTFEEAAAKFTTHPRVLAWLRQGWEKQGGAKVAAPGKQRPPTVLA